MSYFLLKIAKICTVVRRLCTEFTSNNKNLMLLLQIQKLCKQMLFIFRLNSKIRCYNAKDFMIIANVLFFVMTVSLKRIISKREKCNEQYSTHI